MKPLVTGATGLVGGWLVEELIRLGTPPVCLVRDGVPGSTFERGEFGRKCVIVRGDLSDVRLLERALVEYEIDTVFHLAAQTIVRYGQESPLSTFETNVRGTWNLLEACRGRKSMARVVVASSDKAYGPHEPPYVEDMALRGKYPYDVSKSCSDLIAQSYHESYGLPVTVVRCSNIYGPGDLNWSRIVPRTLRFAMKGDLKLELRGLGKMKRDYLYAEDVVDAYMRVASRPQAIGNAYNFGFGDPVDIATVVQKMLDLLDYHGDPPRVTQDGENEIAHQWMDCSKAKADLDWVPMYNLDRGLNKTIPWYKEFLA